MSKFFIAVRNFFAREHALEWSEYAVMLALITVLILAAIVVLTNSIANGFNTGASRISGS